MKKILLPLAAMLFLFGCGGGETVTMTRLVDVFDAASVEGAPGSPDPPQGVILILSDTLRKDQM